MGKKDLHEQIEMLKRTAANASERAKASEAENADLRRELMILQRKDATEAQHEAVASREWYGAAIRAGQKIQENIERLTDALSCVLSDTKEFGAEMAAELDAIPDPQVITEDQVTSEMEILLTENRRLKKALTEAEATDLTTQENNAQAVMRITAEKDLALRILTVDRATLKQVRQIILRVGRRMPKNWQDMVTPSALAAALAKQAPNVAVAVLGDMMEVFWIEWMRMKAENKGVDPEHSVSAAILKTDKPDGEQPEGDAEPEDRKCFTADEHDSAAPAPEMNCYICPQATTCKNPLIGPAPVCFMYDAAQEGVGAPIHPCELCNMEGICLNDRKTVAKNHDGK